MLIFYALEDRSPWFILASGQKKLRLRYVRCSGRSRLSGCAAVMRFLTHSCQSAAFCCDAKHIANPRCARVMSSTQALPIETRALDIVAATF